MIRDITCEEASRYVYGYLDGELEPGSLAEFQHHLETCRLCVGAVEFERRLIDFVRAHGSSERVPEGLQSRVRKVLEQVNGDGGEDREGDRAIRNT